MPQDPRRQVSAHYRQHQPQPTVYRRSYSQPIQHSRSGGRRLSQDASQVLPRYPVAQKTQRPGGFLVAGGVGGSMLALAAFMVNPAININGSEKAEEATCIKIVQNQSLLSRDELTELLDIDTPASRESVRKITGEPYCTLAAKENGSSAQSDREAFPLEFDPKTWFVVHYENDQFVGYDFIFRSE